MDGRPYTAGEHEEGGIRWNNVIAKRYIDVDISYV